MANSINATSTGAGGITTAGDDSGILQLQTNETTAITIDASQDVSVANELFVTGNVGIGTSSLTTAKTTIAAAAGSSDVGATGNALYLNTLTPSTTGNYIRFAGAVSTDLYYGRAVNSDAFVWGKVAGAESMRIDSSGNVLVGTTSNAGLGISFSPETSVGAPYATFNKSYNGNIAGINFKYNGTGVGGITYSNTATAYATSSDYRLKEDIQPMTGALAAVVQLKPVTYKWKSEGTSAQGFIAHELAEVCPDAVIGEKDAVDADGNPVYQGIDTSFLVATLTAAIQEQQAQISSQAAVITTLTERITALEGEQA